MKKQVDLINSQLKKLVKKLQKQNIHAQIIKRPDILHLACADNKEIN